MNKRIVERLISGVFTLVIFLVISNNISMAWEIPDGLEAVVGEDKSVWERVNQLGFGNHDNLAIVALCPYQESLYALTRNDATGFELWKTAGSGWVQVMVTGLTDDNNYFGYLKPGPLNTTDAQYNLMQNLWGDMVEFKGNLYLVVSSGYQGARLYGSVGLEIWRFNGTAWEAVVSDKKDPDESGTISSIAGCVNSDGDTTAQITDTTKGWTTDQWVGCILRVIAEFDGSEGTQAGTPGIRVFDIISNTTDTLTVQQNESAGEDEYTICAEHSWQGETGRPKHVVPGISSGASYAIECGIDERGFGEIWNKSIVDFEILNEELYASIGLNYADGATIWKTADGINWTQDSDYSFGMFHGFDPLGDPTGFCLVPGLEGRNGQPVSSSITNFGKSDVNGTMTLFTGGTGTSGCNGRGARVYHLDEGQWNPLVDYFVDENTTGTNENGFNDADSFLTSNFQAWSWAEYDDRLFVGIVRLQDGSRVMYTDSGSSSDGAWIYAVGGDSIFPDGFGDPDTIGQHLYVYDSALYAGTITNPNDGADIWKATGPADSLTWTRVTGDAFGDATTRQFEAFTTFNSTLYVAASNVRASDFPGDEMLGSSGAQIFRLTSDPLEDFDEDGVSNILDNCPLISNGLQEDVGDGDGAGDVCDNCPNHPNGPSVGSCTRGPRTLIGAPCTVPGDNTSECGTNGFCSMAQEDTLPPPAGNSDPPTANCGDACECEGDFDTNGVQDGVDAKTFKDDFGRFDCAALTPCNGDFDCSGVVDGLDAQKFKIDFGRFDCPSCATDPWCVYE